MPNALASPVPARLNRRAAERRRSIASLVETMTRGLVAGRAVELRERFELELKQLVNAQAIAIRDEPQPAPAEVMTFDLPVTGTHTRARIDAAFEPTRMLDGWTLQTLESATWLGLGKRGG